MIFDAREEVDADIIWSVAVSSRGDVAAATWNDVRLMRFDAGGGETTLRVSGGRSDVVAFSPDGRALASGNHDGTVNIWRSKDYVPLATLVVSNIAATSEEPFAFSPDAVHAVAFSPDGKLLATGGAAAIISIWSGSNWSVRRDIGSHGDEIKCLAWAADGATIASCSLDSTIKLWEAPSGRPLFTLIGLEAGDGVNCVLFSDDSELLFSGTQDGTIRQWEVRSGKEVARFTHTDDVTGLVLTADGRYLISSSGDNTISVWDVQRASRINRVKAADERVECLAASSDRSLIYSSGHNGRVREWKIAELLKPR